MSGALESLRLWVEAVCFVVLLVLLLRIATPPVVWIDATVESGPTAERNRSSRYGFSLLGLAADRQRPVSIQVRAEAPSSWADGGEAGS